MDAFVLLQPGVTNDASFGLLTFRGNAGGNTFLTDGIDTTNTFYDENAGRTRSYNISQDAVQEFQVVTSNFLPEYGRASGGVVNTITRSGTNSIHGTRLLVLPQPHPERDRSHRSGHQSSGMASSGRPERRRSDQEGQAVLLLQRRIAAPQNPILSSNISSTLFDPQRQSHRRDQCRHRLRRQLPTP